MEYLLNTYVFKFLPFGISDEWKRTVTSKAVDVVRVMDWLCKAQDPRKFFDENPSFVAAEVAFFLLAILTLIHAYRHGSRYMYTWLAISILALNVEVTKFWLTDLNNQWHAQGFLTLFGMRVPLSRLFGVYHACYYPTYVFAKRMHLPWWAEGPAVGLGAVMLELPYNIIGSKLLFWTVHQSDPNIAERAYLVPWIWYFFYAALGCSFVWVLEVSRSVLLGEVYDWKKFGREFLCAIIAGSTSFWLAIVQMSLLHHPLHDRFKVGGELTAIIALAFYALLVYSADRRNKRPESRSGNHYWFDELALAVCCYYMFLMMLVLVADPKNVVAEGLHQPIGRCDASEMVNTPLGDAFKRSKYMCIRRHGGKDFDFHCIPGGKPPLHAPDEPLEWYPICGTAFENRAEYILIVWCACFVFSALFYQAAARSGLTPSVYRVVYRRGESPQKQRLGKSSMFDNNNNNNDDDEGGDSQQASSSETGDGDEQDEEGASTPTRSRSSSRKSSSSPGRRGRGGSGKKLH